MPERAQNTAALPGSGSMFDAIAERYDLLNRLMSFGLDKGWRRRLVRSVASACSESSGSTGHILDLATGTADVAIELARAFPRSKIVGVDPSDRMLHLGTGKVRQARLSETISLCQGDAQALEFDTDYFDAVCISFGIRNVPDREKALCEILRVTRSGGMVGILELSEPRRGVFAFFARWYVHAVVPWIGGLLSGQSEYRYLQRSIAAFPVAHEFCTLMQSVGLRDVRFKTLTLGAVNLFTARVP